MELSEMKDLLTVIRLNYPQSFRDYTKQQSVAYMNMMYEAFKDDPAQLVVNAVKAIIYSDTREFAPNIGQIKAKMIELSNVGGMDAQQAWATLKSAMKYYDTIDHYRALPDELKEYLGDERQGVMQLREWATMNIDTLNTVVQSNFIKNWNVRAKHNREVKALPSSVKREIELLTTGKLLK